MMDFKSIYFGCSDAETESSRNPETFKEVFYDPHNYVDELVNGYPFILMGRKGDGKTAFSEKIKLSANEYNAYVAQCPLNNFDNSVFQKIKSTTELGANPYISFWECVLMIECVKIINRYYPTLDVTDFAELVSALSEQNLLDDDCDICTTVIKLVESDTTISISKFVHSRKYAQERILKGSHEISHAIQKVIENLYFQEKKFIIFLDGLDDVLNNSEYNPDIIAGLIRAANSINTHFLKKTFNFKINILIREDIFSLCRDPNMSKIERDSALHLSWEISGDPLESDLIGLVSKRMESCLGCENSFSKVWSDLFPPYIGMGAKPSLEYVLENIIYRPRDILQFFVEIQKKYTNGRMITPEKLQEALTTYSERYFLEAMRDELTGFFPNDFVTALPNILSKMGSTYFYLKDFDAECSRLSEFKDVSSKEVLERLFNDGYIGQHRPREGGDRTVFSYRNPHERFNPDHECILHRGLTRALNV